MTDNTEQAAVGVAQVRHLEALLSMKHDRIHPTNRDRNLMLSIKMRYGDLADLLAILAAQPAPLGEHIPASGFVVSDEALRKAADKADISVDRAFRFLDAMSEFGTPAPLPTDPVACAEGVEKLGRFGHHPDPTTDYECEIDALIGMAYERLTMGGYPDLEDRISRAMTFRTLQTPGELRWLNQTFNGAREIYARKPAWMKWPEDKLAALSPSSPVEGGE